MTFCNFAAIKLLIGTSLLSTTFYCFSSEVVYPIKFSASTDKALASSNNQNNQEETNKAVQQTEEAEKVKRTTTATGSSFNDRKADTGKQITNSTDRVGSFKVGVYNNSTQGDLSESTSSRQENIELDKDRSTQRIVNQSAVTRQEKPGNQSGLVATKSLDKDVTSTTYTYSDRDVIYGIRNSSGNSLSAYSNSSIPVMNQSGSKPSNKSNVTLRDTVNYVLGWHPVIRRSESELQQYEEHIDEVRSAYYPSVNVGVKSGFEENRYYGSNDRSSRVVVNGSQMLYDFGKTRNKVDLAISSTARSASAVDKTVNDVVYESVMAYLQVVRYTKLVDIAGKQVVGFKEINEIAQKRSNLGASAESDYSQAKVRLASAESALFDYQAQLARWSSILNSLTNQDIASKIQLSFPNEIYGACSNININNFSSPGIEIAEAQIEMAKAQVASAKADYFPTISLNPTYEYTLEDESNTNRNRKKGQFGVFVNVSASLYEGGATTSRSRQADQAFIAAKFNLETEKTEARRRIIEATSQIQSTQYSLKAKEQREIESIRTRDLYKLQYVELGSRSFSDLLSAESEIHQTRMDIVNSYFTISNFSIECLYQSGALTKTLTSSSQVK